MYTHCLTSFESAYPDSGHAALSPHILRAQFLFTCGIEYGLSRLLVGRISVRNILALNEVQETGAALQLWGHNYETLYERSSLLALQSFIGARVKLPPRTERAANWRTDPNRDRVIATYESLYEKTSQAEDVRLFGPG